MKNLTYYILTFAFLVLLAGEYTDISNPAAHIYGDAVHYRQMAVNFQQSHSESVYMGEDITFRGRDVVATFRDPYYEGPIVIAPFKYRTIVPWLASLFPDVDVGFFLVTFVCLLLTAWLMRSVCGHDLAGYLFLGTFWLVGYNLSNFWLQDAFVNFVIVLGVWLFREGFIKYANDNWRGPLFGLPAVAVITAILVYRGYGAIWSWPTIQAAVGFYPDGISVWNTFNFLWILFGVALLQNEWKWKYWLLLLVPVFLVGRLVATDIHRVCAMVWFIPVLCLTSRVRMPRINTTADSLIARATSIALPIVYYLVQRGTVWF